MSIRPLQCTWMHSRMVYTSLQCPWADTSQSELMQHMQMYLIFNRVWMSDYLYDVLSLCKLWSQPQRDHGLHTIGNPAPCKGTQEVTGVDQHIYIRIIIATIYEPLCRMCGSTVITDIAPWGEIIVFDKLINLNKSLVLILCR